MIPFDGEIVARVEELAILRDAFAQAREGRGGLVLLRGEPGIGKSTLANALALEAAREGAAVVHGRAWELAEAPSYFPVRPCLRALSIDPHDRDEADAFELWERVLEALARASERGTTVWVLEDLHAADLLTLDLLTFLAHPLRALRVLVVVTARAQDPRIGERASQRLTRMTREGTELALQPLTPPEVATLTTRIVGRALSPASFAQLAELTGGNPLFVVECARSFRSAGAAPRTIATMPHTVRQLVLEQIALLPAPTRRALEAAAVLGREAAAAVVARVTNELPAQVIDALVPAIRAGIVAEQRPGHFVFSHILVRDAVEEAISPGRRAELHARAEAALTGLGDSPEILIERARHALDAMQPDGHAIALALSAARILEQEGAFDRALGLYQRALDARRAGLGPPADGDHRLHVARTAQAAGRHAIARAICEEVAVEARLAADPELFARAALVMGTELRPAAIDRTLVAMLEEANARLGDDARALRCRVRARLAAAMQPAPDPEVPILLARDAIADAHAIGDDALVREALDIGGAALVYYAPNEERRRVAEELLDRAVRADDVPRALRALSRLALDFAEQGDFAGWETSTDRALELSLRAGHPRLRWRALLLGSMLALARGDVGTSNRYVVEVEQFAALTDDPGLALSLVAHAGHAGRLLHRDEEAARRLDLSLADVPHADFITTTLQLGIHARLEDREAAARTLAKIGNHPFAQVPSVFSIIIAEAVALVGDAAGCRELKASFEPMAGRHLVSGHVSTTYEGPVDRVLGLLDSALGDHASAEARLRGALETATAAGHRAWVAQLSYDLGNALFRAGSYPEASAVLARAAATAEDVGMPGLVKRAREKTGAPRAAPVATSAPSFGMAREGEVWCIEHAGRSFRVKDSRGMQLLSRLVERPGEEMHVLALGSDERGASLFEGDAGDALDQRARREYKKRLGDIASDIAAAERDADLARLEKLRREKDLLGGELVRAFGLGGRARAAGSASERARVNVQRRLKDAIARIAEADAGAGRFLEKAIRTGIYCRFGL